MSDNGKVLGALVLGAAAGAVLGLLFAPSKGTELRGKIKDSASDLMDELTDKINEGKETLSELKEKVAARTEGIMSKVEDVKSKAEEEFGNVKNKVKQSSI